MLAFHLYTYHQALLRFNPNCNGYGGTLCGSSRMPPCPCNSCQLQCRRYVYIFCNYCMCFLVWTYPSTEWLTCEGDILYAQRRAWKDPNNVLQSWDPTLPNPCTWSHVTCTSDGSLLRVYVTLHFLLFSPCFERPDFFSFFLFEKAVEIPGLCIETMHTKRLVHDWMESITNGCEFMIDNLRLLNQSDACRHRFRFY